MTLLTEQGLLGAEYLQLSSVSEALLAFVKALECHAASNRLSVALGNHTQSAFSDLAGNMLGVDKAMRAGFSIALTETLATILDWAGETATLASLAEFESPLESVSLLTIHASKGLEFDAVAVVRANNGVIP